MRSPVTGRFVWSAADALAPLVARVSDELAHGRGLALLHGFPIELLGAQPTIAAYSAFGALFGDAVPQPHTAISSPTSVTNVSKTGHDMFAFSAPTSGRTSTPTAPTSSPCCVSTLRSTAVRAKW